VYVLIRSFITPVYAARREGDKSASGREVAWLTQ
jgi:hypothetical protein